MAKTGEPPAARRRQIRPALPARLLPGRQTGLSIRFLPVTGWLPPGRPGPWPCWPAGNPAGRRSVPGSVPRPHRAGASGWSAPIPAGPGRTGFSVHPAGPQQNPLPVPGPGYTHWPAHLRLSLSAPVPPVALSAYRSPEKSGWPVGPPAQYRRSAAEFPPPGHRLPRPPEPIPAGLQPVRRHCCCSRIKTRQPAACWPELLAMNARRET